MEKWFFNADNDKFTLKPLFDWSDEDKTKPEKKEKKKVLVYLQMDFPCLEKWCFADFDTSKSKCGNGYGISVHHPIMLRLEQEEKLNFEGKNKKRLYYLYYNLDKVEEISNYGNNLSFSAQDNSLELEEAGFNE